MLQIMTERLESCGAPHGAPHDAVKARVRAPNVEKRLAAIT